MFESNFSFKFLCVSMLIITSLAIDFQTSDETNENKTRYLIKAQNGMMFYIENGNFGMANVTYDCSLGNSREGDIHLDDAEHPRKIHSVFIKNCQNFSVHVLPCPNEVKSLQITGGQEVTIYSQRNYQLLDIVITHVEMLKWSVPSYYNPYCSNKRNDTSLILKNVVLENFVYDLTNNLHMTGVIAKRFTADEISFSQLTIKDSHFGDFERFLGNARQVYIVNTTFERISSTIFDFRASESFVFSDNHVKKISRAIQVAGPKVEIVGNAIDSASDSIFIIYSASLNQDENIFVSLNVSSNRLKFLKNNLVMLADSSEPDLFTIENNSFYCTCATSMYLEQLVRSSSGDLIKKFLLDSSRKNVCFNFGNCPLRKLLGHDVSVCLNTFVCPEDYSDVPHVTLKEISSELKNLTEAIHLLVEQHQKLKYSDNNSTENYTTISSF